MILDEPFVNLDYKLRESLRTELKSLASNLDTTIIYSTMDPKEALAIADDVLLINDYSFIENVGSETFVQGMADGSEWVMKTDEKIPLKIGNSIEVGVPRTEILKFGSQ